MNIKKSYKQIASARPLQTARHLWAFAKPQGGVLAASLVLGTGATLTVLAQPLAVSRVLNAVTAGTSIMVPAALLVLLFFVDALLSGCQSYLLARTGERVVFSMRRGLVEHLLRLPAGEHDRHRVGDLISRVSTDTTLLRNALSSSIVGALGGVMISFGSVVLMAVMDWVLLLVALLCVSTTTAFVLAVSSGVRRASEEVQFRVGSMSAALDRALGAIRTVKFARAEGREGRAVSEQAQAAYLAGLRVAKLQALVEPAVGIATQAAFVLVLGVGGTRLASGAISLGDLVAFLLYLLYLVVPLTMIFTSVNSLQQGVAAFTRVQEVLDSQVEQAPDDPPVIGSLSRCARVPAPAKTPAVEFASVDFGHHPDRPVLRGLSFSTPRLTRTALVGPSGAGKSTVFALLERFYEPDSGTVLLDGVDVRKLPLGELRRRVGYVEQDSPVMSGSVRSNLLYANPDATEEELQEALDLTSLRFLVEKLPHGLDTEVGDDGVLLSGGERQRIAIARALLARPEVLLLDEATSALDANNELVLREVICHYSERCTVLTIAHRLSTVIDAEQIVVVDEGKVCGVGTHGDLLTSNALYRQLATNQLLGAEDAPKKHPTAPPNLEL